MTIEHKIYDLKQGIEFLDKHGSLTMEDIRPYIPPFIFFKLLEKGYVKDIGYKEIRRVTKKDGENARIAKFYLLTEKGRKEKENLFHELQVESSQEILSLNFTTLEGEILGKKLSEEEVLDLEKFIQGALAGFLLKKE